MKRKPIRVWAGIALATTGLASFAAHAHSASDAYLTLTVQAGAAAAAGTVVHGQWDVALRDLDFVLKLDDNDDGKIVWGELRRHLHAISAYAFASVQMSADGKACTVKPTVQAVDNHADGAYAALFFDVACSGAAKRLTLDYRLFFKIDPSHRGILVLRSGDKVATSVLAPDNAKIEIGL